MVSFRPLVMFKSWTGNFGKLPLKCMWWSLILVMLQAATFPKTIFSKSNLIASIFEGTFHHFRGESRFTYAMRHNYARGWRVIPNDFLIIKKVIEFQSSWIFVYYKIHFRVLLQLICAAEVPVEIIITNNK